MKRLVSLFYALCALIICVNFSTNQSTGGEDKPPINYTGKLVSTDGTTNDIENITVSGLYKDIPVYEVPNQPDKNPALNTTYMNLDAVEKIRPISNNPHESVKKFNNRDYVEIIITMKTLPGATGSKDQHFLVDSTRRIFCDVIGSAGINFKKEVAFEAISSLTMGAFKAKSATKAEIDKEQKVTEDSAAKKALCAQAKDDLKALEAEAQKEPNGILSKLTKSIQDTVHYICG